MLESRILTQSSDLDDLKVQWEDLHKRVQGNVFASYGFCRTWWENIGISRGASLHIAVGLREGRVVALLPLVTYQKRGLRLLRWMADSIFFTSLDLAVDEKDIKELWRQTVEFGLFDFAEINAIVTGTATHESILSMTCSRCVDVGIERAVVFNKLDWSEWSDPYDFSKGYRRQARKRLEKAGKSSFVTFDNIIQEDVIRELVHHKLKWCKKVGLDGPSFGSETFLRMLMESAKEQGGLHLCCLMCGDARIGYIICFASGSTLYGYMIANDAEWNKYSPGVLIHIHAIAWAKAQGYKEFNFMEGFYDFKKELSNHHQDHLTYVFARNSRGMLGMLLYLALNNAWLKKIWRALRQDKGYRAHEKKD